MTMLEICRERGTPMNWLWDKGKDFESFVFDGHLIVFNPAKTSYLTYPRYTDEMLARIPTPPISG